MKHIITIINKPDGSESYTFTIETVASKNGNDSMMTEKEARNHAQIFAWDYGIELSKDFGIVYDVI